VPIGFGLAKVEPELIRSLACESKRRGRTTKRELSDSGVGQLNRVLRCECGDEKANEEEVERREGE
jgi:hypothetical protein